MTDRQMRYLITIYHEGSIRKAAEKLYVSQPALSQQLQRIESDIGIRLFERSTTFLKATYEGRHYLETLEQVMLRMDQEKIWQYEAQQLTHSELSIGVSPARAPQFIPALLPRFHRQYPGVRIDLHEEHMFTIPELLRKNEIDFALMVIDAFVKDFIFIPIVQEKLVLVVPEDSPADHICRAACERSGHIDITELSDEPFIAMKTNGHVREKTDEMFASKGISPNIVLELKHSDLAVELCASGYGITVVAELLAESYKNLGGFHLYSLEHEIAPWTLGVAYHPDHYISRAMEAFIDITKEVFTPHAPSSQPSQQSSLRQGS